MIAVRAEAFGPGGTHKVIEMTMARAAIDYNNGSGQAGIRILSWREER